MAAPSVTNRYCRPLVTSFRQLVTLNGVLFQLSHHLERRQVDVESLLKQYPKRSLLFAGAALIIMDLTEVQPDGFPVTFPVGSHTRQGRRYQRMLDDIAAREAAWTVAQGFEAFEAFLKELVALFLRHNRSLLVDPAWTRRRRPARAPSSRRISDFTAYVGTAYRGASDLQPRLSDSLPGLLSAELTNHRGINLAHWLAAAAAVRHATVHNERHITPKQIARCGPEQFALLRQAFPGTRMTTGYRLTLSQKSAQDAVELLAEYAFLIFREVSLHDGLDPAAFRQMRIRV